MIANNSNNTNKCKFNGCQKDQFQGHEFCGRTHAKLFLASQSTNPTTTAVSSEKCKLSSCGKKVYPGFDFCTRAHGVEFNSTIDAAAASTCKFENCSKAVYPGREFCGKTHGLLFNLNQLNLNNPNPSTTTATCKLLGCRRNVYPGHEFCSIDHGSKYIISQSNVNINPSVTAQSANGKSTTTTSNNSSTVASAAASVGSLTTTCQLSGCVKPVYPGHLFCSKTHGAQFKSNQTNLPVSNPAKICKLQGCNKPTSPGQEFCSKTHGVQFKSNQSNLLIATNPTTAKGTNTKTTICELPGCKRESEIGFTHCGLKHARMHKIVLKKEASVTILKKNNKLHKEVLNQFESKWRHTDKAYSQVHTILQVNPSSEIIKRFQAKRDEIESVGKFSQKMHNNKAMTVGNVKRRFHGTKILCNIGISVCRIIENSFILPSTSTLNHFLRFGYGIYFSSVSSKSNDYCASIKNNPYKYMFIADVIVGNGEKLLNDDTNITQPSNGFDSVLGEVGQSLNHDELIVYDEDQCKPSFIIIYE